MGNIEQLKKEVDEFKTLLDALKNNVSISEAEKKNKAETLKNQAEITKKKIEKEISELAEKTDNVSKKQKEEAEALLKSFEDTVNLQMSILNSSEKPKESTTPSSGNTEKEEKGIWEKTKDFVSEQWNALKSGEKRKEEPGKTVLRVVGFGLTGVAIYKGVKSLWNWAFGDKKKESKEGDSESGEKEEKSFWKTGFGKFLKWTGIGVGVGTLGYWIGKKLHFWGEDEKHPTDNSPDKVKFSAYEEFYKDSNNKESVENYEQLGETIDVTYESLYCRELQAGYQDELTMKRIAEDQSKNVEHYKGIIPFCLDNKFGSIENILSQNSSMREAISGGLRSMIGYVKGLGNEFMKTFVDSFLSKLPSWKLISNFSGSLSEKIDKWIASNQNAEKELQYFFRQSIRVQTYLFEKRDQLEEIIAEDNARKYGLTKEKILKDKDLYKKYVETDERLQKFLMSPISTGMGVLKDNAIFDSRVGDEVKESVKNLDKQRDKVLGNSSGNKDILQVIYEKKEKGETVTDAEKQLLGKSCDGIIKDIDENIMDAVEESAWNIYGDLFRTDDADLRRYLDKSGLEKVFQEYKTKIAEKKGELLSGRLDAEGVAALAETINNMLALKKEAILGSQTIEKDFDENGNIIYRIPGFLAGSLRNLVKGAEKLWNRELWAGAQYLASAGLGTGIVITSRGVVYGLSSGKRGLAKFGAKITTLPVSIPYSLGKWAVKRTPMGRNLTNKLIYGSPEWIQRITIFKGEQGADKLLEAFRLGKISLNDAEEIATKKITSDIGTQKVRDKRCKTFDVNEKTVSNIRERIFDKYVPDGEEGAKFLRELKSNNDLYKKAVKYFDDSTKLQSLIQGRNASMVQIEEEIQKIEAAKNINNPDIVDDIAKPSQELLDNPHYKKLQSDVDAEIKDLEFSKNGKSEAKIKQIDEQIKKLKEFKNNVNRAGVEEVESLEKMYETLIKVKKGKGFFENVDAITKLVAEQSESINKALNDLDGNELKRLIKELQAEGKLTDISDEAITSLTKVLTEIKTNKILKVGEKLVSAFKLLVKYIGNVKSLF